MATPEQAAATQLKNIQAKTGKTLEALFALVASSGLDKVAAQRQWLMEATGLTYGDANAIVMQAKAAREAGPAGRGGDAAPGPVGDEALASIYAGNKAALRPLHDAVMARMASFGPFEVAAKKNYVSLRRKKQFAMLGPATQRAIEIGLNAKALAPDPRLKFMPPASMCRAVTRIGSEAEIDNALIGWLRTSYDEAG